MAQEEEIGIGSRIKHPKFGIGAIIQVKTQTYLITFYEHGIKELIKNHEDIEVIEAIEPQDDLISYQVLEENLIKILRQYADIQETVPLGDKWRGGKLIFQPVDVNKANKEMPIDTFFHKIVMVRDRLRVMEQRINSSNLTDEEKVNLQQYISRIYGSLTSFNVLFKNKSDIFVSGK